jgi:hypothetical protein
MMHGTLRTDYFNPYRDEPRQVDYDQVAADWERRFRPDSAVREVDTNELPDAEPEPHFSPIQFVPNKLRECSSPTGHVWTRQGKCGVQKRYRVKCGICKATRFSTEAEYFAINHKIGPKPK